jgi:hypothetical protein
MPKYEVLVPELHYQTVTIEAESEIDAIKNIIDGDGDVVEGALEYSCVLEDYLSSALGEDDISWMVQEAKND